MGGLTTLLYLKGNGRNKVKGYINIEGNLMPEDCMFSSKVVTYEFETFAREIFPQTIIDMKQNGNTGYHIIANNLQLNTNVRSYYNYSFQTVEYSATGGKSLSYIPELVKGGMIIREISNSNHFVFYDNPKELYDVIGHFINNMTV